MAKFIHLEAARSLVVEAAWTLGSETLPLAESLGRTLATDLIAPGDQPPFANSAMDGFAVRSVDLVGASPEAAVHLRLTGESRAGDPFSGTLTAGEAVAISTGAAIPDGADAVMRVEEVTRTGQGEIELTSALRPGHDVRPTGDDVRAGECVIAAGAAIGAGEIAMLASAGASDVECVRRPRVAIVTTGDELVAAGRPLGPGQIYDSNSQMAAALARASGAELVGVAAAVRDDAAATAEAVGAALDDSDVTIICGGVSVGEHDHVKPALEAAGAREFFWQVAMRPGHPTWFGARGEPGAGGTLIFGLPGNPVSVYATFHMYARPALLKLAGRPPWPRVLSARLAGARRKRSGFAEVLRCRLERDAGGAWIATPTSVNQRSHAVSSMVGVDGLAVLPAETAEFADGTAVQVELLPTFLA